MSEPPPKPRPAPKPGKVFAYRAIYNYKAQSNDELSFAEDDVLYLQDSEFDMNGWVTATCNGKTGLVPGNYIAENSQRLDHPLHEAAKRGNMPFLQECLKNKVSVNALDKSGSTALYWAAHSGHTAALALLLTQTNICVTSQNKLGDTALHAACWKGHLDCVQLLLTAGCNAHVKNVQGKYPIDLSTSADITALLKRTMTDLKAQQTANDGYGDSSEDEDCEQ